MENGNKRLTLNGLTTPNVIYLLVSIGMIVVSGYLTNHFYEAHFPTGLNSDSLCSINEFWGCDKASLSPLGSIFNIPTAFFGIIIGLMGILSNIFPSEDNEKTIKTFIFINAIGCVFLFLYSLISLGSLCPMCTIYYVLSLVAAFIFKKHSQASLGFSPKPFITFFIITLVPAVVMANHFGKKMANQQSLSKQYVDQFFSLATPGDPTVESPYKLEKSTENFSDAPIRLSVFSDFQCPFCQIVADNVHKLTKDFKGKINVQYMFYPLDSACNSKIKSAFHQFACKAAYLSACDKEKFAKIHDFIFDNQKNLSFENLDKWEKQFGLSGCFDNKQVQEDIQKTILAGDQYNLQSTPTIILNGRKLEGSISNVHMKAIMQELLKRSE